MLIDCRTPCWLTLLSVLCLAVVSQAKAQGEDDVNKLPTEGRRLRMGTEVAGVLSEDDVLWWDDTYIQAWTLMLQAGQDVTVDLLSNEFDSFLMVAGPGIDEMLTDDDGAGSCNARVTWTASESGEYRIVVNTIGEGTIGDFVLQVTAFPGPQQEEPCEPGAEMFDVDVTDLPDVDVTDLPIEGRMLTVGREATGTLTTSDREGPDGAYMQAWGLAMSAGQEVTVDLVSDEFDAFLWLGGPGRDNLTDDDGAGACHSRITFTAPEDGLYRVVASTLSGGTTGSYVLRVTREPGPVSPEACEGDEVLEGMGIDLAVLPVGDRRLSLGSKVSGRLTSADTTSSDGSYMQAWGLVMGAGETLTVNLISGDFDAFLWLAGPGVDAPLSDDDGGGACNSRITFTAPTDGIYRIVVNTVLPGETGSFRLLVSAEPGPMAPGPCGGGEGAAEPVQVAAAAAGLAELDVQPRTLRLAVGERAEVLATAFDPGGDPVMSAEFTWTSADPSVVEPEPDPAIAGIAFLTARGGGSTVVRVSVGGLSRAIAVRVVGPSAACTSPGPDYNADGSCFDAPPAPQGPPLLTPPASLTARPTPATLWVKVGEDGKAKEVRRLQDSDQVRFTIAAIQFARDSLTYRPARLQGRHVEAWVQLRVVPRAR